MSPIRNFGVHSLGRSQAPVEGYSNIYPHAAGLFLDYMCWFYGMSRSLAYSLRKQMSQEYNKLTTRMLHTVAMSSF